MNSPKVYVIPTLLGEGEPNRVIPEYNLGIVDSLTHFVVENEKSARRFIKTILPSKVQADLQIEILDKRTSAQEIPRFMQPLLKGNSIGILSEAGMPGIADPGAQLVFATHQKGFAVVPLVGPSSILLALAASGFNGQSFSFHGYLPIDKNEKKYKILQLEAKSKKTNSAEIFMETPYRNQKMMEELLQTLSPNTQLCVACDLTLPTEFILSSSVKNWKHRKDDFHKRPAIFIIQS